MSFFLHCCEAAQNECFQPSRVLGDAFVKRVTDDGLGGALKGKTEEKVDFQPPFSSSLHECAHAAIAIYAGARVGLIERVCVDIDYTGLVLEDVIFILVAGYVAGGERYLGNHRLTPFLRRARCGARQCDECRMISSILRDRPNASDNEITAMIGKAEERAREFFDVGYRRGLLRCAASELHEKGSMTAERLVEIFD